MLFVMKIISCLHIDGAHGYCIMFISFGRHLTDVPRATDTMGETTEENMLLAGLQLYQELLVL